jgi:hypothetical protein
MTRPVGRRPPEKHRGETVLRGFEDPMRLYRGEVGGVAAKRERSRV